MNEVDDADEDEDDGELIVFAVLGESSALASESIFGLVIIFVEVFSSLYLSANFLFLASCSFLISSQSSSSSTSSFSSSIFS